MTFARYRAFAPRRALRALLRCVWIYAADGESEPQRIAPDGCPEFVVHLGAPYAELRETGAAVQPDMLFAGQHTRPLTLMPCGPVHAIGVRFQPDGARDFLGLPLARVTDTRVALAAVHGDAAAAALRATLANAVNESAQCQIVEDYVAARLGDEAPDAAVRAAVLALMIGAPLTTETLSERQLQRRFRDRVGVPPRMLASIFRFRRIFDEIETSADWTETALAAGYFDQPQMARDFRRFLGCTAKAWARQKMGLAQALAAPASESYKRRGRAAG